MNVISPILRPIDVQKRYRISMATLSRWRKMGIGPEYIHYPSSIPGGKGSFGYRIDALERFLESCRRTPRPGKAVTEELRNAHEFFHGL